MVEHQIVILVDVGSNPIARLNSSFLAYLAE